MKFAVLMLAAFAGAAVAVQSKVNGGLGKKVGLIEGSFISFLIGTLVLFFLMIFFGKGNIFAMTEVPKWQLIGGILGALYVFITIFSVNQIGVASTLMAVVLGQVLLGAVIDHFGLFGGGDYPITMKKTAAILLLIFSLYLFHR
ncbi:DMT family transporter [Ureibacillus sp. FSL K6-8385]|uniref:DMT family transporter n=1 Tax=Ureibacillus terrenus TaxID=118246 RepID=A0A540V1R1_9BACL|nr:DMT family transporter [Ureibacillus terrenus]MED3662049.1 DMT family transporter [Ureibacillus terrenus]MED3764672.1 DMT family transporter [Ureibacillus terrenus]TQE90685.1 DMT family transporter [Ureibacillus terrenus]